MSEFHFAIFFYCEGRRVTTATVIQLPVIGHTLNVTRGPNEGTYTIDAIEWESDEMGGEAQVINVTVTKYS